MIKKITNKAKQLLAFAPKLIPGLAGLALISLGVALINLPAGLIVAGLSLVWIDSRL